MEKNTFEINKFNIIEDEENIYLFRALNNADHSDIENKKTTDENGIKTIRTDRQRWEEEKGKAKYSEESELSLEEMWNHIKTHYSKETNCISLSTNANVSIDYGQGYHEQYVMVKVPKKDFGKVHYAGEYMISQINQIIEKEIEKLSPDSEVLKLIQEIDREENRTHITNLVSNHFKKAKPNVQNHYTSTSKGKNIRNKTSIQGRFEPKQYFSKEQQLEYDKMIAKLTILETSGILSSILSTTPDNVSLIATIGSAFSSGEAIHYGEIDASEFVQVSPKMMNIFALIQQLKDKDRDNLNLKTIESKILKLANNEYDLIQENGKLILKNAENSVNLGISTEQMTLFANPNLDEQNLTIENIYDITQGKVSYEKAKNAIEFSYNLSKSRKIATEYADIINSIMENAPELQETIQEIKNKCYSIDNSIIDRGNGQGIQIAESVNIGMNKMQRKTFSNKEQKEVIEAINKLDASNLLQIINNRGTTLDLFVIDKFLEKQEPISKNQYFAEAIVDNLNFEKIYHTAIQKRIMTDEEKQLLVEKLEKADCQKLYNAFLKAGIAPKDISGYIINLLMDNGYKNYNFEELSKASDLEQIISKNIPNLNSRIQPIRMDKLIGIEDNQNEVEGTNIKLRDYQVEAVENVDNIYASGKRFAGVILPTGAGKSFVAMTEMMKFKNGNIVYFAPNTEILRQLQRHILKNVLQMKELPDEKDYSKYVEQAFPHLKMFCYQGLSNKDEEFLAKFDADLIIFDELHRTGAEKWNTKIKSLIDNNQNAKILGITATPVRDVDGKDMMREIAELTGDYTQEELNHKKYLASEMYLLDAMKDQLVVAPKIVTFDYSLENSEEYKEVRKMYEEETDPKKKAELQNIYEEMRGIISKSKMEGMAEIIKNNIKNKSGKYIIFLPRNPDSKVPAEQYVQNEIERIKEYFKYIDIEPEIQYLISDRAKKSDNLTALSQFESSQSEHLKLIFAVDMLNEGVHVDGIDGVVMLRPIGAGNKILYLQQIGRCIYSLDPDNPIPEEELPIIFDVCGNYLAQDMDRQVNKTNPTSDLRRLQTIVNWTRKHGYIPDINSQDLEEARKATSLKSIKAKYEKYINGIHNNNLSETEKYEIQEILELGKEIDLWNLEIPNRTILPGEKEISRIDTFKVTGTQKRFLDLFTEARQVQKSKKPSENIRIKQTLAILDILAEYGFEINNQTILETTKLSDILENIDQEAKDLINELGINKDYEIGTEYNYAKEAFYKGKQIFTQYDIRDLRKYGVLESFITEKKGAMIKVINVTALEGDFVKKGPKDFKEINIYTGTKYDQEGYDINGLDEYGFERGKDLNQRGFYRNGMHKNGTIYDDNGFKMDGTYKETGELNNEYGFMQNGINRETGEKTNKYGFRIDKKHEVTGKFQDPQGFDIDKIHENTKTHISPSGFDIDKNYWEKQPNGTYVKLGLINSRQFDAAGDFYKKEKGKYINTYSKYDEDGFDMEGNDKYGFSREGIHKITHTPLDPHSFNKDREFCIIENGKIISTGNKLDNHHFDINGDHYTMRNGIYTKDVYHTKFDEHHFDIDGYHKVTMKKINFEQFDQDGFWYREVEEDSYEKTGKKFNPKGWNIDKLCKRKTKSGKEILYPINIYGFDAQGRYHELLPNGKYSDNGVSIYDKNGFDENGIHKKTREKLDERNFDRKGYFYIQKEDGTFEKTDKKCDTHGFKIDKLYWYKDEEGKIVKSKFDKYGFDVYGKYHRKNLNGTRVEVVADYEIYNELGFDIDGNHRETGGKLDTRNFDRDGYFYEKQEDGTFKNTNKKYDENYFSIDKFFCKVQEDGKVEITKEKYDTEGYDANGLDKNEFNKKGEWRGQENVFVNERGFNKQKICERTGLPYDEHLFDINEKNIITHQDVDIRGFGMDGRFIGSGVVPIYISGKLQSERIHGGGEVDPYGFDINGIHQVTHEKYDENNYNAYRVDKDGKMINGEIHPDILFARVYMIGIANGNKKCKEMVQADLYIKEKMKQYDKEFKNSIIQYKKEDFIRTILYAAGEMYPPIKEQIVEQILEIQESIKEKETMLEELRKEEFGKKTKIKTLEKERDKLKESLKNISDFIDL